MSADAPVRFVVYSDWLCPWCYLGAARLWRLEAEHPGQVELEWRSYLLRRSPGAGAARSREISRYTRGWKRSPPSPTHPNSPLVWHAAPPSHSLPAQVVSKSGTRLGDAAYRTLQRRLFPAYFTESRDISSETVLREIWGESAPPDSFPTLARCGPRRTRPRGPRAGARGRRDWRARDAPREDHYAIVGAQPYETLVRWLSRTLERRANGEA